MFANEQDDSLSSISNIGHVVMRATLAVLGRDYRVAMDESFAKAPELHSLPMFLNKYMPSFPGATMSFQPFLSTSSIQR